MPRLIAILAACAFAAAVADQNASVDNNGELCIKADCASAKITNHCDRPVNFAHCHADSEAGCLMKIDPNAQIAPGESLPFLCQAGKLAKVSGCFPPFIPVSFSAGQNGCIPNPQNPEARSAAADISLNQSPQTATPPPAPTPAPEAPNAPRLTQEQIRAQEREAEAAMQKARELVLQASEADELSLESAAEVQRLREQHGEGGGLLQAGGKVLHGLAIVGAAYLVSKGKTKEAKSMLEAILKVKGKIDQNTRQRAEALLAQINEAEAKQQQHESDAENLTAKAREALRGAPPPTNTPTENALKTCGAWNGQLNPNAVVNTEGNKTVFLDGWTCWTRHGRGHLYVAAILGDFESARWLLANGAEVNAKDNNGWTLLLNAMKSNSREMVELLLQNGAEVNAKNNGGWTLLHNAVEYNSREMVELLLQNGADANAKDRRGNAPLYYALDKDTSEMVELLLQNGADANAKQQQGFRPLHIAALFRNIEMAELLLQNGAEVNAKIDGDRTPLDVAISRKHFEMQSLLRQHGGRCGKKC